MGVGRLSLVGTPIGNLADLGERARQTLLEADVVVAEDTRRTRALLAHLGARGKRLVALHAHSEERRVRAVVERALSGERVAVVTDAGMPGVSDPASELVRAAVAAGLAVEVVPGPSAVTAAVALSGLVSGPFLFLGFLPRKGPSRRSALEAALASRVPVVLFESPERACATLEELAAAAPERPACVCRELTKLHETCHRGSLAELAAVPTWRGELTLVVAANQAPRATASDAELRRAAAEHLEGGRPPREVARHLAEQFGVARRVGYRWALEAAALRPGPSSDAESGGDPGP